MGWNYLRVGCQDFFCYSVNTIISPFMYEAKINQSLSSWLYQVTSFLIIGDFINPGMVLLTRGVLLTWIWVFGVRRHFKEVYQRIHFVKNSVC